MANSDGKIIGSFLSEAWLTALDPYCSRPLIRGDRIRIREGYEGAGTIGTYFYKSNDDPSMVIVLVDGVELVLLAEAIVAKPYTREERIERVIEDFEQEAEVVLGSLKPLFFAILDAGV
jgi:hypothetical protein